MEFKRFVITHLRNLYPPNYIPASDNKNRWEELQRNLYLSQKFTIGKYHYIILYTLMFSNKNIIIK